MIFDIFLALILIVIYAILTPLLLLPDVAVDTNIGEALVQIGAFLTPIDAIFPIDTLLFVLKTMLLIEVYILLYKGIMWIVRRFPTQS